MVSFSVLDVREAVESVCWRPIAIPGRLMTESIIA